MSSSIQWVRDDLHLAQLCARWNTLPYIALDTEFMRVDTFYPIAGLVQLGYGDEAWLLDPLTLNDWRPFAQLLGNSSVVKAVHACSEDLEVLQHLTGALPHPLFDTQLAAAYLNLGFSMGYSRLVEQVLGLTLPKGETRSDWLQRPLSPLQVQYAAEDVLHLGDLYLHLHGQLSKEKLGWVLEDGAELVANLQHWIEPEEVYQNSKQGWRLNSQQLAVLRALMAWRERQARARNQPRNRVLRENSLWPLARIQPTNLTALSQIEDMHPRTVRRDGPFLLELICQAAATPEAEQPQPLPQPLPMEAAGLLKKLRALGLREAKQLDMAPELVLKKKILEKLLKSGYPHGPYQLPDSLRGWRRERMGQALLDIVERHT